MKILQVCTRYFPCFGGVQEHVRNISERLAKTNDVTVATTDPTGKLPKEEIINSVHVIRFKSWAPSQAYYISRGLQKYLSTYSDDFDIVHAHGYHSFPALYAAQGKDENKFVFTSHYHGHGHTFFRSMLHKPYARIGKKIFEKSDKVICVSDYEKNLIIQNFKVPEPTIVVIPNGVSRDEFVGLSHLARNDERKVILYVGRIERYKGIDSLVKVLPEINENIHLEIVGTGPYESKLVDLISKIGVSNRVSFFQNLPRKELLQRYADADLVALLSTSEAYAITVAEALVAGTPCLVAKNTALSEWVDNSSCFGVDLPVQIEDFAKVIADIIHRTAHKRVTPNMFRTKILDWNTVVEKLECVYSSLF
jgi:glycosyltransferase involved in cell wall biosynthesis